jgi:GDPmannose 4,6-dehydratase
MSDIKSKALIFGITGMTGSYLAEFLLEKGYEVHGIIRRSSSFNTGRIDHIFNRLKLHYGDVTDSLSVDSVIQKIKPDEIYNLSAQSHVQISFELPYYTGQVDGLGVLNVIESARKHTPNARILQSSTSELFGGMEYNRPITGYTEESPMHPRSPYSVAKLYGFWICKNYKESYNQYIVNTICFNHSGPRRGGNFVEKKIVDALVRIVKDIRNNNKPNEILTLGNLYSKRDIGYAKEYAEGMWFSLQQDKPDDYVLATNETYTIKDMVNYSLDYLNIEYYWKGEGLEEKCYQKDTDIVLVSIDEKYFRPSEVDFLLGDATKAKNILGWEAKTKLPDLLKIMIDDVLNK